MAFLPDQIVASKLEGYSFDRFTDRTITDAASFRKALDKVRKDGFAANDREEYDSFLGISAPIFNYMGEPIAVLNIWTMHTRHSLTDIVEWSPELLASTTHVTSLIGGAPPF